MRFRSGLLVTFLTIATGVFAEDPSDSLFANPEPDTQADTSQKVSRDVFTGQTVRFFETLNVDGLYVTGLKDDGSQVSTPVNALDFGFGSDVRLDRTARAYASFDLAYPTSIPSATSTYNPYQSTISLSSPTNLDFSNVKIKELFLDYSLGDLAIIRMGRQSATWGQGRFFNPSNFMDGIGSGMAVKLSSALGPLALTTVAIKNDSEYPGDSGNPNAKFGLASVAAAGLMEYSGDLFSTGLSAFYHARVGSKGDWYLKTSLWGADLFTEGLFEWWATGQISLSSVSGLYREFGDSSKWLKLQSEYLISGRGASGSFTTAPAVNLGFADQTIGIGATTELLSSLSLKPSVLWLHSLYDSSGQVVMAVVNNGLPHIDLTLALVRVYGNADGRYVVNNPDPEKRLWSLTLKASFSFELKN